jgi:hypothetical protein
MFLGDGGRRRSLSLRWNCCFLFPDFESSDFLFLMKLCEARIEPLFTHFDCTRTKGKQRRKFEFQHDASNVLCIIVHLHISLNACLALHKLSLSRGVTSRSET